jgi:hypothetical protein
VRFCHTGPETLCGRVCLNRLDFFKRDLGIRDAVGAVNFLCDKLDTFSQRDVAVIQEFEIIFLLAGVDYGLCKLNGAVASLKPVFRDDHDRSVLFCDFFNELMLGFCVGREAVYADDGFYAAFFNDIDVGDEVFAALFEQAEVLFCVFLA